MTWEELNANISTYSIFDLKTKYKDYKARNIGLDFYGFDAVLPINEISNNYELSFSLFNILQKGELISLVLIDIDEKNRRLTFSTKVFRNALDDILSFTKCKYIVENNRNTHLKIDIKFLKQNRNILNRLRGDLSSNELTFLYELVQNAVDHPNRTFKNNVSVKLEVINNFLLVKHNGALFTENNFESITGILYGEQIQEGERNRIGYKGIGFKSVFRFTDNAYIRSGNFSFRFSKADSGIDKPWEVLPLFQLEKDIVAQIPQFDFFNAPVAFAFEFNSEQSRNYVIKYLNQLSQNPYLLIFLENLTQLKIKAPSLSYLENGISQSFPAIDEDFIKEITKSDEFDSINLLVNSSSHSEWLIYTKKDIVISDVEVINELLDESVTAVPAKMRHFRTPIITIALPKKYLNDEVINLFTYLPLSNSKFKLPFLVNADFIPDLDRTDIIHNLKYNNEVLKYVAVTLQELAQKLAQSNQFEYLNTLLPDLSIEYQSSGDIIVKRLLDLLPQTIFSYNDQQLPLSKIAIDKSGFVTSFGLELYKSLIDKDNVPLCIITKYKKISKFIEKINPDNISDFHKLKEKVRSVSFRDWLKDPGINFDFIYYLISNNHLDLFNDESIFLAKDGKLYKGSELMFDLGSDEEALEWLSFKKVLHQSILFNLSDTKLPTSQYESISFITEIICREKKVEIITGLNNGTISFDDFYSYLAKYASNPLFPAAEIKSFPIQTVQTLLPNWSGLIYFNSNSLNILLSENALPIGLYHLLDKKWNCESNSNLKVLAERLGVLSFIETEPYNFIQTILIAKKDHISRYYLSGSNIQVSPNVTLWSFLIASFDNLSEPQKEGIKSGLKVFPVLSKIGVFKELHTLYMPSEFTDNDALETLSLQFPNSNIDFVSAEYLKHPSIDKTEIRALFKKLDAKIDTKDFLQHTLIPNLNQMSTDLFVPLTRLLYENRDSEPIINAVIRNPNFKLKTKENIFKPLNECYVGSPYIDETQIPNPFIAFPVLNQISLEYSNSHLDAWQRFFSEKLKISDLKNETEIISLKLRQIADNIQLWQNAEASILLLKDIYLLYKSGNLSLNTTTLTYIKKIPLLSKGESAASFHTPNAIHFSSAYKPTFDFEKIFGLDCGLPFLSDSYKFDDTPELIQFFEQIGVTQLFDSIRHSAIYENIPTADGQKKPAKQLFKYVLKKFVGQSGVAFEDLAKYSNSGMTLEDYFGFKSKLDVSMILNYITSSEPNRRELKDLISELLRVYNPNTDRNLIDVFISEGKLLSSAKTYNFVRELHSIDESIRSGIRENEYLIDLLFSKQELDRERYLKLFNIRNLKAEDFNPEFDNQSADSEFTNRVKERLVFFSFDIDSDKYLEIENEFKVKFNDWKVKKCSKIFLKYPASNSKITKEDNRNFVLTSEKIIYYIGSWIEQRNVVMVNWLRDNILSTSKQLQFVQDILLNNPTDIISDFENKGRAVPDEIKQKFIKPQPTQQNINSPEATQTEATTNNTETEETKVEKFENPFKDITPDDETFIRGIIKGEFELNEKLDAHKTAKIKTLLVIKVLYDISEITDEGRFLKAGKDEILVRSAQSGILYLDVYNWGRLSEENVSLSVYTNDKIEIYSSQKQLFDFTKPQNKFGIVRMPTNYTMEDYNSLDKIANKGEWHYIFIVNENTKAAQGYKDIMDYSDPDLFKEDNF